MRTRNAKNFASHRDDCPVWNCTEVHTHTRKRPQRQRGYVSLAGEYDSIRRVMDL